MYLALHPKSGKQLVCKVVNLDDPKNKTKPEARRRKFQEADILRQLQHVSGVDEFAFLESFDQDLGSRMFFRMSMQSPRHIHCE